MAKEIKNEGQRWLRLIIFALASTGVINWLSSRAALENKDSRVKAESIDKTGQVSESFRVLGEKANNLLPEKLKKQIGEATGRFSEKTNQTIEKTEIIQQVKKTMEQATEEIGNFPKKQEKQLRRQIIQEVCNDLLKEEE